MFWAKKEPDGFGFSIRRENVKIQLRSDEKTPADHRYAAAAGRQSDTEDPHGKEEVRSKKITDHPSFASIDAHMPL